jgi:hypothetical protein
MGVDPQNPAAKVDWVIIAIILAKSIVDDHNLAGVFN